MAEAEKRPRKKVSSVKVLLRPHPFDASAAANWDEGNRSIPLICPLQSRAAIATAQIPDLGPVFTCNVAFG